MVSEKRLTSVFRCVLLAAIALFRHCDREDSTAYWGDGSALSGRLRWTCRGLDMPSVFLSYALADVKTIQILAPALQAQGIAVWRDQDSLYGGERWPKAIGEAIVAHDWFLLAWSQHAARSHFVEFE